MTHSNFTGPAKLDQSIKRLASGTHPPKPIICRPKKMSLNALLCLECSARHLSFTKAAEELGVSLFAVSAQVRNIEQRFGQPLFVRSWRSLELTELGQVVFRHAKLTHWARESACKIDPSRCC